MNRFRAPVIAAGGFVLAAVIIALWVDPRTVGRGSQTLEARSPVSAGGSAISKLPRERSALGHALVDPADVDWENIANRDPQAALARLSDPAAAADRSAALAAIARGWARRDPSGASLWVSSLESTDDQVDATLGLVSAWGVSQPDACYTWLGSLPAGAASREVGYVELADHWQEREPARAFDRFLTHPAESGSERALQAIACEWAVADPDSALAHLSALPINQRRDEFLEAALVSLGNEDPDRAWLEAIRVSDPSRQINLRRMALEAMAEIRPLDAVRFAETSQSDLETWCAVARGWAIHDHKAAIRWAESQTDPARQEAIRKAIDGMKR